MRNSWKKGKMELRRVKEFPIEKYNSMGRFLMAMWMKMIYLLLGRAVI